MSTKYEQEVATCGTDAEFGALSRAHLDEDAIVPPRCWRLWGMGLHGTRL